VYFYDNDYTVSEFLKTVYSFVLTKVFYRNARLIRRPFYLRGKPRMEMGKGFTTGFSCRIEIFGKKNDKSKKLIIGENCKIGDNVHIAVSKKIEIGQNCLMASKVFITDSSHGEYTNGKIGDLISVPPDERELSVSPVIIGDNVWIGENVCILKGVVVGSGSIIGANSVVIKDVEENTIIAGIPAKPIKKYNESKQTWENVNYC